GTPWVVGVSGGGPVSVAEGVRDVHRPLDRAGQVRGQVDRALDSAAGGDARVDHVLDGLDLVDDGLGQHGISFVVVAYGFALAGGGAPAALWCPWAAGEVPIRRDEPRSHGANAIRLERPS